MTANQITHRTNSFHGHCAFCDALVQPGQGIVARYSNRKGWKIFCSLDGCYRKSRGEKRSFARRAKAE